MQAPGAGGSHASHHAFALFTAGSSLFQGYGLSILFLASRRPELANDWGSLFYTFSMSNAVLQYQSMADFPYEFLVENSPWAAMGMLLGVGWLPD